MKLTSIIAIVLLSGFSITSCVEDNNDPAGTCVTCTTSTDTFEACANGDGTITLVENGVEAGTNEIDLFAFQTAQEANGATCN